MSGPNRLDAPENTAPVGLSDLDLRSTRELVALMNDGDAAIPAVVAEALDDIAGAIDAVVERLARGGRLVFAGAGTPGTLGAAEAAECGATFSTPPEQVLALVAGGRLPPGPDRDAAEDAESEGAADADRLRLTPDDAVVAVSASGATPYTLGVARTASAAGALTVAVVASADTALERGADRTIAVAVGPELIAGSTRLRAGTAQKLVLNMLSTISMIRLGKAYGGLMVDVRAANSKLQARARRIVAAATDAPDEEVDAALAESGGNAKVAILSLLADVDARTALARLQAAGGNLRKAIS
jgi:N-acetylmuramic acid 6-phosphate etherase